MKFYVETFGCQMNTADSEEMSRHLAARGFSAADRAEEADWILVNTCTVRQHAEHKALSFLGRLRDWKREKPGRRIILAGCAAERLKDALPSKFSHVDAVVGARSIAAFPDRIRSLLPEEARDFDEFRDPWSPENAYTLLPSATAAAHVTIMRGCNYSCTYCIVPQVRGRELYRPPDSVLAEVRQKAAAGACEVLLLGQTVNSYRPAGATGISDFADLLRAVDAVPGVERVRFMSPHPAYLSDRMIRAMAESAHVCPHIHLPVQSGSDPVLRRMRRNYSRQDYLERLRRLRQALPAIAVTTDLIVGFPGETEEDFAATLSLVEEADFDGAYCFKYSPRPGTPAAELGDTVPREVKEERHARLLALTERLAERKVAGLLHSRQEILVENILPREGQTPLYEGRNRSLWKVRFSSRQARRLGERVPVMIAEVRGRSLVGIETNGARP
jgi:tRNA-2-methylthio-N6-dimethylallyladenosine synthase